MIPQGHDKKPRWFFAFFFSTFFSTCAPIDHPLSSGFRETLFSTDRVVCHSWLFCGSTGHNDDTKRRAISFFFLSLTLFQHSLSTQWLDGCVGQWIGPFYLSRESSIPAPLATHFGCSKHLDTPHSLFTFNLAILKSPPGASNFASLCDNRSALVFNGPFLGGSNLLIFKTNTTPPPSPRLQTVIERDGNYFLFFFSQVFQKEADGIDWCLLSLCIEMIHTRQQRIGGEGFLFLPRGYR